MEENATNSKAGEENDSQGGTPSSTSSPAVAPNNTPVSTPDLTPSRRSSRKKQSTFSSDFEYYSIGRKKDTPKEEKEEAEEKEADKEDAKPVAKKAAQAMQRKVAVRGRPPGKAVTPKASNKKVTPKAAVKKAKTTPPKKTKAKGKAKEESEDEEEDDEDNDDQDEEESAEEVETKTPVKKTQKRKKAQSVAKKKKAKKADPDEEQESMSDDYDDDSTPISKLKAQMVTPEPKQLTSPPAKKKISVLTATSPLAKNLMSKLKKASMEVLSSPEGLLSAKKRKLSVGGKTENGTGVDDDDVPLKKLQVEKQEKDESEADPLEEAGLIKRSPSEAGLVKRSPSEIAKKKTGATVKTESKSTVDKIEEEINDTEAQLLKTNEPVDDVTEKKTHNADAQTSKKEKVKNEDVSGGDAKKKSGAVEKVEEEGMKEVKGEVKKEVKKEIKKDVKAAKGEGSKKLAAKAGSPVKKESNVVKRVMKVVKTADGRVIKGEVRILKDGRKVMVIDGKQKVLVTGKDKEKKQAASVDQKAEVKKDGAKKVESTDQGAVKKVVKTPDGKKKVMKKDGGKVSPPVKSKTIAGAKKSVDGTRKTSIAQVGGKKVDDLLKRGVMVKKKRHQPFGNKKTVTKMVAPPPEVEEKQVKKRALSPKSAAERKERKKSVEKATVKKGEETERRKSSDSSQHVRDRSQSTDSSKGDRRKSADLGKPASSEKNNSEEAPPTLIPANAVSKPHKHKHHHKPEHDTSMLDMTMNDLFKPDAIFTPKKEQEAAEAATVKSATTATAPTPTTADDVPASTAAPSTPIREDDDKEERASDADSPIKPQNLPNVLIEHKYSKPTSPVDGEAVPPGLEQQDLNSISIPTSKFVTDMTLPDQFMEELEAHDKEAGKQDKEGGKQDKEGGKQDKNGGKQDKEAGKQDKEAGKQDKEAGKQDKDGGKQDKDGGKQDKEGGKQDKEAGKQDKEGGKQDKEGGKQDKDDAGRNKSTELSEALDNSKSAAVVGSSGGGGSAGSTDRSCILQTLDTEIQEGGSDFLIVGQVEIERPSVVAAKEEKVEQVEMVKIPVSTTEQSSSTSLSSSKTPEKSKDPVITAPVVKEATEVEESDVKTVEKPKRKIKVKRQDSSDTEVKEKKKKVPPKEKTPKKDKEAKDGDKKDDDSDINDEDEGEDFVDDENDDDWDDPTTLYCICKKPHGNRFMICCDKCEEWYHGSCVGVTRARGKEMEDNEEEYICRSCHKNKTPSKLSSTTTPIKPAAKSPVTPKSTTTPSSSTTTTTTSSSSSSSNKALPKLCVGKKCPKTPRSGSAYCSNECIMSHTQDSLKAIREEEIRRKSQDKFKLLAQGKSFRALAPKMLSTVESVVVIDKDTEKVIMGSAAPSYRNLRQWLEDHPTFQVFLGGKHKLPASAQRSISTLPMPGSSSSKDGKHKDKDSRHSSSSSGSHHHHHKSSSSSDSHDKKDDKSRRESKDGTSATTSDGAKKIDGERRRSSSSSSSSKTEGPSSSSSTPASHSKPEETNRSGDGGPNQVRLNVRTALRNSLSTRAEGADDIMLSSNEIKNLAMTIEEELFNLFMDTGHKYRTKYRSLVFNIKDTKNKGLFRKILTGKIKPYKLVQMSTEEMASRELARWREKETQHQLEMIEQTEKEKEILVATKHIRKKTHKGEIEVEDEDLSILEARVDEKVDKVNESQDEMIQVPVVDTTDQHRAHLFDLNCKVCTGKIVPGPEEQQMLAASSTKKVTFSFEASTTKIISDDEQCAEPDDFAKAEEIVKEAMRTVKKTSEAVSSYSPPPQSSESPPDAMMPESPPPESTSSLLAMSSSPKHDSVSSSSSAAAAAAALDMKKVVVRSPDSALQSGLEVKAKFVPTGPLLWKGCISMLDVAKFFTSAYRVSGPFENITIPDTIHIMGRISPEHMWDYLSKIRQAGSKDLTVVRFIPGSDDEKVAYVHLYSYLNSRSRCGVAGSDNNKQIKDFYVIPLASHSKIPRTLLPFDGPGLEENRPHMLIGIIVKQRGKHSSSSDSPSTSSSSSKSKSSSKNGSSSSSSTSSSKHQSTSDRSSSSSSKHKSSSSSKDKKPVIVNRDPRLAKLAAAAKPPPSTSPTGSTSSVGSSHNSSSGTPNIDATASPSSSSTATPSKGYGNSGDPRKAAKKQVTVEKEQKKEGDVYEPEYVPMPVKAKVQPIAEYVPTVKKKDKEMDSDDSEPYSPGKEAEPYSPSQEAQADEPYDPGDETLMDGSGVPLTPTTLPQQPPPSSKSLPSTTSSSSSSSSSSKTTAASSKSSTPAAVATTTNTASAAGSVTSTTTQAKQPPAQPTSGAAVGDGGDGKKKDGDGQVGNLKLKSTALVTKGGDSPFSIDDCVEKMARSNNPTEISSLMVTALSTASSPEEQQKLLVDLTKRVEERKLQLANLLRASAVASASASATSASYNNPASGNSSATGKLVRGEESVTNVGKSADSTSTTTATTTLELGSKVSSSSADDPAKDVASADSSSALSEPPQQQKGFGFGFMRTSSKTTVPLSTTSADIFNSDGSKTVTADVEKPMSVLGVGEVQQQESSTSSSSGKPQIPHALKALMDDVLGNTQGLNEEKRQKILKKEEKKQKDRGVEDEPPMNDDCSEKTEAERRMEDELEAQKILEQLNESEKAIGLPGGGKKETSASGSAAVSAVTAGGDGSSATGGGEPKKDKVPTIDELLEKLKKGGFQFPVAAGTGKTSSSTAADAAAALSSTIVSSSTTETTSSTTTSSLTLSVLGNLDTQDVDLRTATGTPPLLSTVTSSMGMTENPTPADTIAACLASLPKPISSSNAASISPPLPGNRLDLQDIDHRKSQTSSLASLSPPLSTTAVEKDDHFASSTSSFYEQDRDDRIFHQSHQPHPPAGSNRPKHPLDPRAFPPLPGELPRGSGYPHPPHHPLPPRPSGHFPQPKSGRAQPPPPGTELEATPVPPSHPPPHPDLHVSDIDMRSGNHHPHHRPGGVPIPPPLPPEQAPPPLPPQPPPPLPPLPGNRGGGGGEHPPPLPPTPYQDYPAPPNPGYPHHEHLPPSDVDFRSHHHPHPHHLPPPQHPHHHHQQPPHPHHHHPHQHHPHHQSSSHHPPPSSHHSDNWYHDRGGGGGDRDRERDRGDRRDQDYHRRSGYSRNGGGGGRRH